MAQSPPGPSNALLVLFPYFNTLDANGPLEVLRKSGKSDIINVTIASETELTTANEGATIQRHISVDKARKTLSEYDLLVVPGGPTDKVIEQLKETTSPFMALIKEFSELDSVDSPIPRILLSVCTGALFLGSQGIFNNGRYCTTHYGAYSDLANYNVQAAGEHGNPGQVLPARYVDSGVNDNGVRIISSGGISCGIDGSLHVVRLRGDLLLPPVGDVLQGETEARGTAEILDYAWRKTEGVTFGINFATKGP